MAVIPESPAFINRVQATRLRSDVDGPPDTALESQKGLGQSWFGQVGTEEGKERPGEAGRRGLGDTTHPHTTFGYGLQRSGSQNAKAGRWSVTGREGEAPKAREGRETSRQEHEVREM